MYVYQITATLEAIFSDIITPETLTNLLLKGVLWPSFQLTDNLYLS